MTTSEEILFKLGIDATRMEHSLREIKEKVRDWSAEQMRMIAGIAAGWLGIEGIKSAYEQLVKFSEETINMSHRLGISTDALQVWDYALKRNGGTIDEAAGFFEHLAEARDKALGGGQEGQQLIAQFKQLGITVDDLRNKRIEQIAEKISELFHSGGDAQQLIGALREIGGRGAGDMIATFRDGIAQAREEVEKLGIAIDKNVLYDLKEAGERADILGARLRGILAPFASKIMNAVTDQTHAGLSFGRSMWAFDKSLFGDIRSGNFSGIFHRASGAFRISQYQEFLRGIDEQKAIDAKRRADEAGGGPITSVNAAEHQRAVQINKEAAQIEERAQEHSLSLASQIAYLHLRRNHLQDQMNDKTKTELENAQTRKDLAQVNLDLAEKQTEQAQKQKELAREALDSNRRLHDMKQDQRDTFRAPSFWTVEELAKNPMWFRGGPRGSFIQDNYSMAAHQIELLEQRAHSEARFGNRAGADADLTRARGLRDWLEKEGVIKPDHAERMVRELADIRAAMTEKGIKVQDDKP